MPNKTKRLLNILRIALKPLLQIMFFLSYAITTSHSKLIAHPLLVSHLDARLNMGSRFLRYVSHYEIHKHWSTTTIRKFFMWLKKCHEMKWITNCDSIFSLSPLESSAQTTNCNSCVKLPKMQIPNWLPAFLPLTTKLNLKSIYLVQLRHGLHSLQVDYLFSSQTF